MVPLKVSEGDEKQFKTATNCWLCNQPLSFSKAEDHFQLTGKR